MTAVRRFSFRNPDAGAGAGAGGGGRDWDNAITKKPKAAALEGGHTERRGRGGGRKV
jgi:hypothetical protein